MENYKCNYIVKKGIRCLDWVRPRSFDELLKEAWNFSKNNEYKIPDWMRSASRAKAEFVRLMRWYPDLDAFQARKIVCASYGCDNWFELMIQLDQLEQ